MLISTRSLLFGAGALLLVAGCAPAPPADPDPVPVSQAPPAATSPAPPPPPAPPAAPAAPWAGERLAAGQVPAVFAAEWRKAANRATCALVAPAPRLVGATSAGATPRAAYFSGGWSVAYDQPGLRSAFGVAGTGSRASDPSYDEWPHRRAWPDGSSAGYGPEGGSGPNQLAYLRIQGQDCLYNVWSRLGCAHLELLLESLRFVAMP